MPTVLVDNAPSPAAVYWAAEQVIRQHAEPASEHRATGRCKQCGPDG